MNDKNSTLFITHKTQTIWIKFESQITELTCTTAPTNQNTRPCYCLITGLLSPPGDAITSERLRQIRCTKHQNFIRSIWAVLTADHMPLHHPCYFPGSHLRVPCKARRCILKGCLKYSRRIRSFLGGSWNGRLRFVYISKTGSCHGGFGNYRTTVIMANMEDHVPRSSSTREPTSSHSIKKESWDPLKESCGLLSHS